MLRGELEVRVVCNRLGAYDHPLQSSPLKGDLADFRREMQNERPLDARCNHLEAVPLAWAGVQHGAFPNARFQTHTDWWQTSLMGSVLLAYEELLSNLPAFDVMCFTPY